MSVPTDISLVDFLLEKDDNILSLDKDSVSKSDQKDFEGIDMLCLMLLIRIKILLFCFCRQKAGQQMQMSSWIQF